MRDSTRSAPFSPAVSDETLSGFETSAETAGHEPKETPASHDHSRRNSLIDPTNNTRMRLQLSIKAELENVTNLVPSTNDFEFFFQVKCNSCNETHPKYISLNRIEEREVSGGKGSTAHFVWRCGLCKRESSAKFEPTPFTPYDSETRQFQPLLVIDCRGLEFIGFDPKGFWKCTGTTGAIFPEVDLSEGEWTDYDEKASLPVGISEFESRWDRA